MAIPPLFLKYWTVRKIISPHIYDIKYNYHLL